MKILLDYVFPISVITPTPAASTAFLKQVIVVAKPKSGEEGNVGNLYLCTSMTQVAARTDNANAQQLFNAGMARVYVLLSNDLDLEDYLAEHGPEAYTVLISDDFDDDDLAGAKASGGFEITAYANLVSGTDDTITVGATVFTAQAGAATPGTATFQAATSNDATAQSLADQINAHATAGALVEAVADGAEVTITAKARGTAGNSIALGYTDNDSNVGATKTGTVLSGGTEPGLALGTYEGVVGVAVQDMEVAEDQAVIDNRCAFFTTVTNKAKNMFYAFGSLLSNPINWTNQQYIQMPFSDSIDELGEANALFDSKISFVMDDDEFGKRLALFCAGSRAIVAPYILKNLRVNLQSRSLQWISGNQPQYTLKEASLLEATLQEDVINSFIARKWISAGTIAISLVEQNFVANAEINVAEPKALWRVFGEMRQTL